MPLPRIDPLELGRLREPFDHDEWIFELKHDGFRAIAYVERGNARLISGRQHAYRQFDVLCRAIAAEVRADEAILDGEIVCLDEKSRPIFNELLRRRGTPCFVAFDLIWLDGRDLRELDLVERRCRLRTVIPR